MTTFKHTKQSIMDPVWVKEQIDAYVAGMKRFGVAHEIAMSKAANIYLRAIWITMMANHQYSAALAARMVGNNLIPHAIRAQEASAAFYGHACRARELYTFNSNLLKERPNAD